MTQAFIVVLREGFEGFLIAAIILAYLKKTVQLQYVPAVYWGIGASLIASALMGYLLWLGASGPLWEGIFGLVSAILVSALVIHMWKTGPHLKKQLESGVRKNTEGHTNMGAWWGVFFFTVLMIAREGMETALLLIQIHEPQVLGGAALGVLAASGMAFLWVRFAHLINLKRFFQVTAIFLMLFVVQILVYSFHEFTEAGVLPNSEILHKATEVISPEGLYGKWFSLWMVGICGVWLVWAWIRDKFHGTKPGKVAV